MQAQVECVLLPAVSLGESTNTLELMYRRSVGPVVGGFLAALRDGSVVGSRTRAGRVIVPPLEYDPETGDAVDELVPVGSAGVVRTWSYVVDPMPKHPLQTPFAWVLVQLDGADTTMLHALDVGSPDAVQTGMRVQIRWKDERVGHITDIACFEPEAS